MNTSLQEKILSISKALSNVSECSKKHFTFLCYQNKIISIGINSKKTHPKAKKLGYRFDCMHSELVAIANYNGNTPYNRIVLINTRINRFNLFGFSRPCNKCLPWLLASNFKRIYYTDDFGNFIRLGGKDDELACGLHSAKQ